MVLLCASLTNTSYAQCYEFGITDGYLNPDPILIPGDGLTELTYQICNEGDDLPLDPNGGMGFSICPSVNYLSPTTEVYGSATEYFSFSSFLNCEIGTQTAMIPAGTCLEFKIMYESLLPSFIGEFIDDTGTPNGLHCVTANIAPSGIYSGGTCHMVNDDYLQVCTYTDFIFPVEIVEFTATKKNDATLLKWKTASELNNKQFDIEHSKNGIDFKKIGEVRGAGTSNDIIAYDFTDPNPAAGVNYYRLKQIDFDGTNAHSEIRQVNFGGDSKGINIFPNPAVDFVKIENAEQGSSIQVYDMLGKVVLENTIDDSAELSMEQFVQGAYIFRVLGVDGETLFSQKIFVSK